MADEQDNLESWVFAAFSASVPAQVLEGIKGVTVSIGALHAHFVTADALDFHLRRSLDSVGGPKHKAKSLRDFSEQFSAFRVVAVFYALIFVLIEGYREAKLADDEINGYLADAEKVDALRRFRNATFHFQKDPLSKKMVDFLEADLNGEWVRGLFLAFRQYFERELQIRSFGEFMEKD